MADKGSKFEENFFRKQDLGFSHVMMFQMDRVNKILGDMPHKPFAYYIGIMQIEIMLDNYLSKEYREGRTKLTNEFENRKDEIEKHTKSDQAPLMDTWYIEYGQGILKLLANVLAKNNLLLEKTGIAVIE